MNSYFPLLVILVVAWLVPMVLSWLEVSKVPSVIVEILLGIVLGPFVLNLVTGNEVSLKFLSDMGFLLLIFLSGLAIDVQKIVSSFPRGKIKFNDIFDNTFILAVLIYVGSFVLSILLVNNTNFFPGINKPFLAIIIPSAALSIIVPVIKNDGEIERKFGQIILLTAAISTIFTILFIAIYAGFYRNNGFEFELLLFLIIFLLFFIAYKIGTVLIKVKLFQKLMYKLEHASSQIRVRGSIAVLLLFVVVANTINTEPVLGAFFAGTLLSIFLPKDRSALIFKLDGMSYGFFIPIFFIMVGVKLDMSSLRDFGASFNFIIALTAAYYVTQIAPALIMAKQFGWKRALSSGILLTSRLGLSIATAQIGLSLGLITSVTNAGIVIASIITCILSPLLYKILSEKEDQFYNVYIIGGGQTGLELAKRLSLHRVPYLVIESQWEQQETLTALNIKFLDANDQDIEVYKSLKIRPTDTVVIVTSSEKKNVRIAKLLRKKLNHSKVITVTTKPELYLDNELSDIKVINIDGVTASNVENEIMRPGTMQALTGSFGAYTIEEITVRNKNVIRKFVREIPFPLAGSLVAIRRDSEILIPHGDTHILEGDLITVIGNAAAMEEYRKLLE